MRRLAIVAVALLSASCQDRRFGPGAVTIGIDVSGPATVPPGDTRQFTVVAHGTDGDRNVTADATWRSTNPDIVTVSGGLARGVAGGDASISASFQGFTKSLPVRIIPDGTFLVQGYVRDAASGLGLPGAEVQVTTGPFAGTRVTTDFGGLYRLFGVAGDVTLQATRPGYRDWSERIVVVGDQTVLFRLDGVAPTAQIDGNYRLTMTVSARCRDVLPVDLRIRSYAAEIRQSGSASFVGWLSEADFLADPQNLVSGRFNDFYGRTLAGGDVTLDFEIYGDPSIVERVGMNLLSIAAWGPAHFDGSRITGALTGTIGIVTTPLSFPPLVQCEAPDHLFELVRQ